MSASKKGPWGWELDVDEEGHRTYTIRHTVLTSDPDDGPYAVFNCPGLPLPGVPWNFGNDADPDAFCYPNMVVRPTRDVKVTEKDKVWETEQKFSTRPLKKCSDQQITNPLNEPPKLRGSFTKFKKQVAFNRNGFPVVNTAYQPIVGPETEFDDNRPTVGITMNIPTLPLGTIAQMVDTVNDGTLWGLGPRRIKLSNVSWERLLYGTCNFYYTVTYEFEVNFNTWDRIIASKGTVKAPDGSAPAVKDADGMITTGPVLDPTDYEVVKDKKGEKLVEVYLDIDGQPTRPHLATPILISYYEESNFLTLGIPTSF